MKTQMEAYLKVADKLPIDDPSVLRRLERADRDILRGYGYSIKQETDGSYTIDKLSTAPMGSQDNGSRYTVSADGECTCPDWPTARANLCKHRLATMIWLEMHTEPCAVCGKPATWHESAGDGFPDSHIPVCQDHINGNN